MLALAGVFSDSHPSGRRPRKPARFPLEGLLLHPPGARLSFAGTWREAAGYPDPEHGLTLRGVVHW